MKNLELGRDGFLNFDQYPQNFKISAKNRKIFKLKNSILGAINLKMVF